jgi:hypothetical protein
MSGFTGLGEAARIKQKAESKKRKAESRKQKAESRKRKAESGKRKAESGKAGIWEPSRPFLAVHYRVELA